MSLYAIFINENFYRNCMYYFGSIATSELLTKFDQKSCYKYIKEYFKAGSKETVFKIDFSEDFKKDGKHVHTVVLYLMGYYLKDIVEVVLKNDINHRIDDKINNPISWFDFRYTWFLCCLYHDTASVIEKEKNFHSKDNCVKELNCCLRKYNIKYNVYDHIPLKLESNLFTFPEHLVKKYFFYRMDYFQTVDHGILGGFLIFDRLMNNYNSKWEQKKKRCSKAKYEDFKHNNLSWKREHQDHFVMIADSIIAHNIWFSGDEEVDKELYKQYGLDQLIATSSSKIKIKEKPLLFFLCLLDTIEPTKRFPDIDAILILKSFDISYCKEMGEVIILQLDLKLNCEDYFNKIKQAEGWLDIEVIKESERLTIKINV